jgi:hypothetical protein
MPALGKNWRLYLKNNQSQKKARAWLLPSNCEALSSNLSAAKKNQGKVMHNSLPAQEVGR